MFKIEYLERCCHICYERVVPLSDVPNNELPDFGMVLISLYQQVVECPPRTLRD
jgi:hypothetical protein